MKLGKYVAGGVIDEHEAVDMMMAACASNGLLDETGRDACMATIESGMSFGKTQPKGVPERSLLSRPASIVAEAEAIDNGTITQDGIARVFAQRFADKHSASAIMPALVPMGGYALGRKMKTATAFHFVRELGRELTDAATNPELKEVRRVTFAGGVERYCRSDPVFAVTAHHWDTDPFLLGTPGRWDGRSAHRAPSEGRPDRRHNQTYGCGASQRSQLPALDKIPR